MNGEPHAVAGPSPNGVPNAGACMRAPHSPKRSWEDEAAAADEDPTAPGLSDDGGWAYDRTSLPFRISRIEGPL